MLTQTKQITFSAGLHRVMTSISIKQHRASAEYRLSKKNTAKLHDILCGCNHPPDCVLWNNLETDLEGYYHVLMDEKLILRTWHAIECSCCGKAYQGEGWSSLASVGHMDALDGKWLELRNCNCGSTLSRAV